MFKTFRSIDRTFLIATALLVALGFFIFTSASLGLLAREGARLSSVAASQIGLGLGLGTIALFLLARTNYRSLRPAAFILFGIALFLTILTLIPGIGFEYNGARRWLHLGPISFQPSEFLKFAYVIALAAWLASFKEKAATWRALIPFGVMTLIAAVIMLMQPDTGTFLVMVAAGVGMLMVSGLPWRYLLSVGLVFLIGIVLLAYLRPYVMDRITTFLDPSHDPQGSSYQLQQALIAVGSGGLVGRGFGQGIQKLTYLPEPIGDSVFAVYAEEFGFIGSAVLIGLFLFFAIRGLRIASRASDLFGALLAVGFVVLITSQSFINIGSMLGIFPLTGVPLLFVSHGGSALLFALAEVGVILSVSRKRTR